jgi:tetratricopeptide (TPR) repeat protein
MATLLHLPEGIRVRVIRFKIIILIYILINLEDSILNLDIPEISRLLIPELLVIVRDIKNSHDRSYAMISIGKCVNKLGDQHLAKNIFLESIQNAQSINNKYGARSDILCEIGISVSKMGDLILEKSIFLDCLNITKEIEIPYYSINSLQKASISFLKMGEIELFKNAIQKLLLAVRSGMHPNNVSNVLNNIAELLWRSGDKEQAQIVFQESIILTNNIKRLHNHCETLINIEKSIIKLNSLELVNIFFPLII